MAHKRGNGEGSIYQREADARWFGSIVVGFDANGRQKRRTVSAKSRRDESRRDSTVNKDWGHRITKDSICDQLRVMIGLTLIRHLWS